MSFYIDGVHNPAPRYKHRHGSSRLDRQSSTGSESSIRHPAVDAKAARAPWYQEAATHRDALAALDGRPDGAFMIRNSITIAGAFVLTYRFEGKTSMDVIYYSARRGLTLRHARTSFPTLSEWVAAYCRVSEPRPIGLSCVLDPYALLPSDQRPRLEEARTSNEIVMVYDVISGETAPDTDPVVVKMRRPPPPPEPVLAEETEHVVEVQKLQPEDHADKTTKEARMKKQRSSLSMEHWDLGTIADWIVDDNAVEEWKQDKVVDFLVQAGLAEAVTPFTRNKVDGRKLLTVSDLELTQWGIAPHVQASLRRHINRLKKRRSAAHVREPSGTFQFPEEDEARQDRPYAAPTAPPAEWDVWSVRAWLLSISEKEAATVFKDANIDGLRLLELDEHGLVEIGVEDEHSRQHILEEIASLRTKRPQSQQGLPDSVLEWSPVHVELWLRQKGFGDIAPVLRHHTIHGTALLALNHDALEEMGITDFALQSHLIEEVAHLKSMSAHNVVVDSLLPSQWAVTEQPARVRSSRRASERDRVQEKDASPSEVSQDEAVVEGFEVEQWDNAAVCAWLTANQFSSVVPVFRQYKILGSQLSGLKPADLRVLGVAEPVQTPLLHAIHNLFDNSSLATTLVLDEEAASRRPVSIIYEEPVHENGDGHHASIQRGERSGTYATDNVSAGVAVPFARSVTETANAHNGGSLRGVPPAVSFARSQSTDSFSGRQRQDAAVPPPYPFEDIDETLQVVIEKGDQGFGFTVEGADDHTMLPVISHVLDDSPAYGKLIVGDLLLAANGRDLRDGTHQEVIDLIKRSGSRLRLTVQRRTHQTRASIEAIIAEASSSLAAAAAADATASQGATENKIPTVVITRTGSNVSERAANRLSMLSGMSAITVPSDDANDSHPHEKDAESLTLSPPSTPPPTDVKLTNSPLLRRRPLNTVAPPVPSDPIVAGHLQLELPAVQWSMDEVVAWLSACGLDSCFKQIHKKKVDGLQLLLMSPIDIERFCHGLDPKLKIAIACLQAVHGPVPPAAHWTTADVADWLERRGLDEAQRKHLLRRKIDGHELMKLRPEQLEGFGLSFEQIAAIMDALGTLREVPRRTPTRRAVEGWSTTEVGDWLAAIRMGQFRPIFRKRGVEGAELLKMDQNDLVRMGIKDPEAQTRLLTAVASVPLVEPRERSSMLSWTTEEVNTWLRASSFDDVADEFARHRAEIDGYGLCALSNDDLVSLGVEANSVRQRLLTEIEKARAADSITSKSCTQWTAQELLDFFKMLRLGQAGRGLYLQGVAGKDLPALNRQKIAQAGVVAPSTVSAMLRAITWALNSTAVASELPVKKWTARAVRSWLVGTGHATVADAFEHGGVDGQTLLEMKPEAVDRMLLHRNESLVNAILDLQKAHTPTRIVDEATCNAPWVVHAPPSGQHNLRRNGAFCVFEDAATGKGTLYVAFNSRLQQFVILRIPGGLRLEKSRRSFENLVEMVDYYTRNLTEDIPCLLTQES